MEYYKLEPWGADADDIRAGIVASTVANVNRDPKQRRQPYAPGDFVPKRDGAPVEEQSPEEQMRILEMFTAAWPAK